MAAPLSEVLETAARALEAAGIAEARREARLLAAAALGLDQAALLRDRDRRIDPERLAPLLARRVAREPLARVLGRQGFWTGLFATSPATLVPRADSETLIEAALAAFPSRDVRRVLDLGTGTGCLLLAALAEFPDAFGVGVDRVAQAAGLAAENARSNALAERAAFLCGDWGAALSGRFDLVLCNPPYIRRGDLPGLMPEVALFEPVSALDGGFDGLDCYRAVIAALPDLLTAEGVAILELGAGQGAAVHALAAAGGLVTLGLRADLGGVARSLSLRRELPRKNHLAPAADAASFTPHGRDGPDRPISAPEAMTTGGLDPIGSGTLRRASRRRAEADEDRSNPTVMDGT